MSDPSLKKQGPERADDTGKKIILVLLALFVSCLMLAGLACFLFFQTEAGKTIGEVWSSAGRGKRRGKRDVRSEKDYETAIQRAKQSGDPSQIMQDEFAYADFLQGDERYSDAVSHYLEAEKLATTHHWPKWEAACLERIAWGQHKLFIKGVGDKPDPELMAKAIRIEQGENLKDRNDAKDSHVGIWMAKLGVLYADNGKFDDAERNARDGITIDEGRKANELPDDYVYLAQVKLRQGKIKEAASAYRKALPFGINKKAMDPANELVSLLIDLDSGSPRREIRKKARRLCADSDFAGLEKLAQELRSSKGMYPHGGWHIDSLYTAIDPDDDDAESRWQVHLEKMRKWVAASPDSVTAKLALANSLTSYAWRARGGGYADTVSPEGWRGFEDRLDDSKMVLEAAAALKEKCPFWYPAMQTVALGQSEEKEQYNELVEKCIGEWPTYYPSPFHQMWYLQPRWYGEDDEWVAMAARRADAAGGKDGDKLYARLVWYIDAMNQYDDLFEEFPSLSWSRLKSGFSALKAEFPKSNYVRFEFAKLAAQQNDEAVFQEAVK